MVVMKNFKMVIILIYLVLSCSQAYAEQLLQACSDREQTRLGILAQEYIHSSNRLSAIKRLIDLGHQNTARIELKQFNARSLSSLPQQMPSHCEAAKTWLIEHQKRQDRINAHAQEMASQLEAGVEMSLCQVMFENAREKYELVVVQFEKEITATDYELITQAIQINSDTLKRGECPAREIKRLNQMAQNLWQVLPPFSTRAPAEN
jgi:hypothetical protein